MEISSTCTWELKCFKIEKKALFYFLTCQWPVASSQNSKTNTTEKKTHLSRMFVRSWTGGLDLSGGWRRGYCWGRWWRPWWCWGRRRRRGWCSIVWPSYYSTCLQTTFSSKNNISILTEHCLSNWTRRRFINSRLVSFLYFLNKIV